MNTTDGAVELLLSPLSNTGERSVSFITSAGPILLGKKAAAVLLSPRVLHYERVERITAERERSGGSAGGLFGLHKMEQDKRYTMSAYACGYPSINRLTTDPLLIFSPSSRACVSDCVRAGVVVSHHFIISNLY
jgi:hypothetical protein